MADSHSAFPRATDTRERASNETGRTADAGDLLSLLGDEYTREVLATLGDQSLPAREIIERSDASRPTVYRRLDRLETAGVVEAEMAIHPDGQHRREFRVAPDELAVSLVGDSVTVADETLTERSNGADGGHRPRSPR
jgi:DNA-binding transcriptional ArsR family regulator